MSKCENCRLRKESAKAFDIHWLGEDDCPYADCPVPDPHNTNAVRIRSLSDEELAKYLAWLEDEQACYQWEMYGDVDRITEWLEWLREEVTE